MPAPMSKSRRQLLACLEGFIGAECYNASIQNYGPGGVRESNGRGFRYPITFRSNDGTKMKVNASTIPASVPDDIFRSGYYTFGANQLDVLTGLELILSYLEKHHGLVIDPKQ